MFSRGNARVRRLRSSRGAFGALLFVFGIFIILLLAIVAVDISHFVSANVELQCAVDAAALMGAYDLQWNSTDTDTGKAAADAKLMAQRSFADVYSPSGLTIPPGQVNVSFSSLNGGRNNAITVTMNPPILFLFAPTIGNFGEPVGVSATAERLPVSSGPAPPWFLETSVQGGPSSPSPLPSPAPAPPTTFPTNAHVTFFDSSKPVAKDAPPVLPTYWVDMGLSNLSTAQTNPVGVAQLIRCMGQCVDDSSCNTTNPIIVDGSVINANHGSYDSNVSNPEGNSEFWSSGKTVFLPVTTGGSVTGVYIVKLTGPYEPKSFSHGEGVFGEFGVQFVGSADSIAGVTVMDPTAGTVYNNVGATVAVLVK